MARIGIYLEPGGVTGGAQTHAAVLAEWLSQRHDVDFIVRQKPIDLAFLGQMSQTDLRNVRLRVLDQAGWTDSPVIPWQYDLFIPFVHLLPPACPAPHGVLMVLFPWRDKREMWPWSAPAPGRLQLRQRLRLSYHEWRWQRLFSGYQACTANSRFTQGWLERRWGISSSVVYPPVLLPVEARARERRPEILSVGRFSPNANSKRQLDLIGAYQALSRQDPSLERWRYLSVGGVSDNAPERNYFDECQALARDSSVVVRANLSATELHQCLGDATIFWHGAGYGTDEVAVPQHQEHFGMVTVEAMAHGCVPIVVRRGGQPEIVDHGVNGFLWESLEDLGELTLRCVKDPILCGQLAARARIDAGRYSRDAFIAAMSQVLPRQFVGDRAAGR